MCHRDFQGAILGFPLWDDQSSPKVPPEVIWLIACGCQRKHYYPRDTLASWQNLDGSWEIVA